MNTYRWHFDDRELDTARQQARQAGTVLDAEALVAALEQVFPLGLPVVVTESPQSPAQLSPAIQAALSEAELVIAAQYGDAEAFCILHKNHRDKLYSLCHRMLPPEYDAEQIALDALLKAWQQIHQLQEPSRFGGWLRRIAINLCRDELKRRQIDTTSLDAFLEDAEGSQVTLGELVPNLTANEAQEMVEWHTILEKWWEQQSAEVQRLLICLYSGNTSFKEIGRERGGAESGAYSVGKRLIGKALTSLHTYLQGQGLEVEPSRVQLLLEQQAQEEVHNISQETKNNEQI